MSWQRPRQKLFLTAGLDLVGTVLAAALIDHTSGRVQLFSQPMWVLLAGMLFLLFGWLLGSYTVLRWPYVPLRLVVLRLSYTLLATMVAMVLLVWLSHAPVDLAITHRTLLTVLMLLQGSWSLLLRILMRQCMRRSPELRWQLMAGPSDAERVDQEWRRNPFVLPPQLLSLDAGPESSSRGLALGSGHDLSPQQRALVREFTQRGIPVTSLETLAEQQLERLPPALLPDEWLRFRDLPWSSRLSVARQLKRVADVLVSGVMLLVAVPLLLLACLAIWLEDRGPVIYRQTRTGWMGRPFVLYKLRTMRVADPSDPPLWTVPRDSRITRIGQLLRRIRIDELPQLLNVLRGDMSLIGPRPERPEFDVQLAASIPHYRKRYWMPPGLSGWAQVCAPYAASLKDAEHKLSYDLYYLRHFSIALDLLILTKTIKTVIWARGR